MCAEQAFQQSVFPRNFQITIDHDQTADEVIDQRTIRGWPAGSRRSKVQFSDSDYRKVDRTTRHAHFDAFVVLEQANDDVGIK